LILSGEGRGDELLSPTFYSRSVASGSYALERRSQKGRVQWEGMQRLIGHWLPGPLLPSLSIVRGCELGFAAASIPASDSYPPVVTRSWFQEAELHELPRHNPHKSEQADWEPRGEVRSAFC
jgi:hypothetical protein